MPSRHKSTSSGGLYTHYLVTRSTGKLSVHVSKHEIVCTIDVCHRRGSQYVLRPMYAECESDELVFQASTSQLPPVAPLTLARLSAIEGGDAIIGDRALPSI